jgi:hypothetical protein
MLVQVRMCLVIAGVFLSALVILRMSNAVHGETMRVIADILGTVSTTLYLSIFYFLHRDKKSRANGDSRRRN